jgi:hypothetical protein
MIACNKDLKLEILFGKPGKKILNFQLFAPVTYITPMNEHIAFRQNNTSMTGMSICDANKLQE